jgi:Zn-dependent peptidase ImmA (M78 family)/transcriptional regulator with XRE-family HTH domain
MSSPSALDQARNVRTLFDGGRLRLARELRGLSQQQLGSRAGTITGAAVSQFERDEAKPNAGTLAALAEAVEFPVSYFARSTVDSDLSLPAFFRSLRSTSARQRRQARAYVELIRQFVLALERHIDLPPKDVPHNPVPSADYPGTAIETIASHVREQWELPPAEPIDNVVLLLERHGVVTTRVPFSDERIDAFSVAFPDRPICVLCSGKNKKDRSRHDGSHELGHLVMHSQVRQPGPHLEQQAHRFAAAFLMPAGTIASELPSRVEWKQLLTLKHKWGVSLASLLYRARTLGCMTDAEYLRGMKTMSARGWRADEPGDLGAPESPRLLHRAVEILIEQGFTIQDLAHQAALPSTDVQRILEATTPPRPTVTL